MSTNPLFHSFALESVIFVKIGFSLGSSEPRNTSFLGPLESKFKFKNLLFLVWTPQTPSLSVIFPLKLWKCRIVDVISEIPEYMWQPHRFLFSSSFRFYPNQWLNQQPLAHCFLHFSTKSEFQAAGFLPTPSRPWQYHCFPNLSPTTFVGDHFSFVEAPKGKMLLPSSIFEFRSLFPPYILTCMMIVRLLRFQFL